MNRFLLQVTFFPPTFYLVQRLETKTVSVCKWNVDSDWEPAMRIKIAERKLCGANPKHLFAEELRSGQIARYFHFPLFFCSLYGSTNYTKSLFSDFPNMWLAI